jgi:hypothetical protein
VNLIHRSPFEERLSLLSSGRVSLEDFTYDYSKNKRTIVSNGYDQLAIDAGDGAKQHR